jgi:glycogen(starch) synthase
VKVVFHPDFVSLTSLFSLDYDQFVRGCHMGIFPSYYEPWGYTPLECLALGLPTVTTDLSGFGAYVERHVPDALQNGVLVLNRSKVAAENCIEQLTSYLIRFCELNRRERIALRNRAERITERFTWDVMAAHYHRAHSEALRTISQTTEPRTTSPLIPRGGIENLDTLTISPDDEKTTASTNEAQSLKSKR